MVMLRTERADARPLPSSARPAWSLSQYRPICGQGQSVRDRGICLCSRVNLPPLLQDRCPYANRAFKPYIRPGGSVGFTLAKVALRAASCAGAAKSPGDHTTLGERSDDPYRQTRNPNPRRSGYSGRSGPCCGDLRNPVHLPLRASTDLHPSSDFR